MRHARLCTHAIALLVLPLALAACVNGVNGSVDVPAGSTVSDASTVNGSVRLAANAKAGKASTVNGSIHLADGAQAGAANTVNGDITLEKNARISGDATTVNGALNLAAGSAVSGALTNVNGRINIDDAHIGNGVTTVNGDIDIAGNAVVDGGIKVEKSNGNSQRNTFFGIHFGSNSNRVPRIVIDAGATVNGPLTFERPVKLFVSDQAKVAGPISGANAVKFTGAAPKPGQSELSKATTSKEVHPAPVLVTLFWELSLTPFSDTFFVNAAGGHPARLKNGDPANREFVRSKADPLANISNQLAARAIAEASAED